METLRIFTRREMVMSTSSAATDAAVEAILAEFRLWLAREQGIVRGGGVLLSQASQKSLSWLPDPRFGCAAVGFDAGHLVYGELLPDRDILVGEGNRNGGASLVAVPACDQTIRVSLAGAVPAVAGWRLASLPR